MVNNKIIRTILFAIVSIAIFVAIAIMASYCYENYPPTDGEYIIHPVSISICGTDISEISGNLSVYDGNYKLNLHIGDKDINAEGTIFARRLIYVDYTVKLLDQNGDMIAYFISDDKDTEYGNINLKGNTGISLEVEKVEG